MCLVSIIPYCKRLIIGDDLFDKFKNFCQIIRRQIKAPQYLDIPMLEITKLIVH